MHLVGSPRRHSFIVGFIFADQQISDRDIWRAANFDLGGSKGYIQGFSLWSIASRIGLPWRTRLNCESIKFVAATA